MNTFLILSIENRSDNDEIIFQDDNISWLPALEYADGTSVGWWDFL